MNAVISGLFPVLATRSTGYPFLFFCGMVVLQFLVVLFLFPETKGVTLEHLEQQCSKGRTNARDWPVFGMVADRSFVICRC